MTNTKNYPLDYYLDCRRYRQRFPETFNRGTIRRRTLLKNLVFEQIIKIRQERKRPSLSKMLTIFKAGN